MMIKSPYQIALEIEALDLSERMQTIAINKAFRLQDDSHLFPIRNRFNATERAIKQARAIMSAYGQACIGLEYCLTIDSRLSSIVNNAI